MTDVDKRIAEWSRADAPEGSPALQILHKRNPGKNTMDLSRRIWSAMPSHRREDYARMAVAAIDAYVADKVVIEVTGMHK